MLAPWLLQLYDNCNHEQLRDFINSNRIGVPPLATDSNEFLPTANAMVLSLKNVHANYKVLGFLGFIIPKIKYLVCNMDDHQRLCRPH